MKKNGLYYYENTKNAVDASILGEDSIAYSVLRYVLLDNCKKVFTDKEKIIVCQSHEHYPIWVWLRKDAVFDDRLKIERCLVNDFPITYGYVYNMSESLYKKLIELGHPYSLLQVRTKMDVYRCNSLKPVRTGTDDVKLAEEADLYTIHNLYREKMSDIDSKDYCVQIEKLRNLIDSKSLLVARDENGNIVSMAGKRDDGVYGRIINVYTASQARNKGYANAVVHKMSEMIIAENKKPVLYVEQDNDIATMCYKGMGFEYIDTVLTVSRKI